jgi:hypothetical protein
MTVILFIACACNYNNTASVDRGLDSVITLLENQGNQSTDLLTLANNVKESHKKSFAKLEYSEKLVGVFNNENTKEAQIWMRDNEQVISTVLTRINVGIENDISEINKLSKDAYLEQIKENSLWKYTLVYFRLQYLRNDIRKSIETLSPLTFIIHSTALAEDTESLELRKKLEEKLLTMVGIGIVIDQDYNQVRSIIKNFKEDNTLPESLRLILSKTDQDVNKEMNAQAKKLRVTKGDCAVDSTDEKCQQILDAREAIKAQYEKISFLYSPGQKYFLITKVLSFVGNLTWGLANTLIGAGVVLAAIAASPFTPYVDFPSFHLSASGMQIYVNVTGMSPIPGKMSLGLFELDNASGFGFASYHEGGHAIQSAVLGPFYLPAVLITYVASGFDQGLMENLADKAARASDKWI